MSVMMLGCLSPQHLKTEKTVRIFPYSENYRRYNDVTAVTATYPIYRKVYLRGTLSQPYIVQKNPYPDWPDMGETGISIIF